MKEECGSGNIDQSTSNRNHRRTNSISLKTALRIAENDYRRRILLYLIERGSGVPLREIVEYLVQCNGGHESTYQSEEYRRIYTTVTQNHLCKLKEEGIIREAGNDRRIYCDNIPPKLNNLIEQMSDDDVFFDSPANR